MGMSASQARLIALTARMSDTEYEAQQINQQRVTLSNQMNAVYEATINMEVPTPPSKYDPQFMNTVYRGKYGLDTITVKPDGTGKMVAFKTIKSGSIVSDAGGQNIGTVSNPESFVDKSVSYTSENFKTWTDLTMKVPANILTKEEAEQGGYTAYGTGSYSYEYTDAQNQVVSGNKDVKDVKTEEEFNKEADAQQGLKEKSFTPQYYTKKIKDPSEMISGDNITYTSNTGDFSGELKENDITTHNNNVASLLDLDFVVQTGNSYKTVTAEELQKGVKGNIYVCTNPTQFEISLKAKENNMNEGETTVGGRPLYSLTEAKAKYLGNPTFENALNALRHSFTDYTEADLEKEFHCIVNKDSKGNLEFSFCMTDDIDNGDQTVTVYEVGVGSYDEQITDKKDFDPENIKYDNNGNIREIIYKGDVVSMSTETQLDEDEYEKAMNQYKSDKNVYDQEQNRLNKQTSIYQRQDKMLELKLTRLESERNALNTEIDAVKKVIQDDIDKSFKTFSG